MNLAFQSLEDATQHALKGYYPNEPFESEDLTSKQALAVAKGGVIGEVI